MFVPLTTKRGQQVLVNFSLVTVVSTSENGTNICFTEDDFMTVREGLEEIYDKIRKQS